MNSRRFIVLQAIALLLIPYVSFAQHYEDVTEAVGLVLNTNSPYGGGAACVDIDKDGWQDLIFTTDSDTLVIYRNLGDFQFELVPAYLEAPDAFMVTAVDYDRDGDRDLFVSAHGSPDCLFRQTAPFEFENATSAANLSTEPLENYGHNWFDANNDGWLDLLLCAYSIEDVLFNQFYLNNQDGTFIDYSEQSGLAEYFAPTIQTIALDFDGDGWQDVYAINDRNPYENRYYKNLGDSTFADLTEEMNLGQYINAMSNTPFDFNRDGLLDLYVSNNQQGNLLLTRNSTEEPFEDVALAAGVPVYEFCWGAQPLDFDNDGWEDLLVCTTLNAVQNSVGHNHLYRNEGDGSFALQENEVMETLPLENYVVLQGDLDNDGYLDMVTHTQPEDTTRFWRNTGTGAHFLEVNLRGTVSNRDAIGAQVDVFVNGAQLSRWMVAGSDYLSQRPFSLHFGLGEEVSADSLVIQWPSGIEDRYYAIPADMRLTLEEGWASPPHIAIQSDAECPWDNASLQATSTGSLLWSTGESSGLISVENSGWVSLSITHPQGFTTITDSVFVEIPEMPEFDVFSIVNCANDSLGSLNVSGVDAGVLTWSSPAIPTDLPLGETPWSLTDGAGCIYEGSGLLVAPDSPMVSIDIIEPSCFGYSDGQVSPELMGGVNPQWNLPFHPDSAFAGIFSLEVSDEPNCVYSFPFTIDQPEPLSLEWLDLTDSDGSGIIEATISGGTEPYSFIWNGEEGDDEYLLDGPETVELEAVDAQGCAITGTLTVTGVFDHHAVQRPFFPNPCVAPCQLQGDFLAGEVVTLHDLQGRSVVECFVNQENSVDLSHASAGVYLLKSISWPMGKLLLLQ